MIDTATMEPGRNPVEDLDIIENELSRYGGLEDRPRLVALNKIDVPDGRDIADIVVDELRERGLPGGPGLGRLGRGPARADLRDGRDRRQRPRRAPVAETTRIVIRPPSVDGGDEFTVEETDEGWRVRGVKPERWVRQTDFSNDEAVGLPRRPAQPARGRDPAARAGRRRRATPS